MGQVQGRRARATGAALAILMFMVLGGSAGAQAPAPEALSVTAEPSTVRAGVAVTFTATVPQTDLPKIDRIDWSFGDGTGATGGPEATTAQHAYAGGGSFSASVTVTRRNGTQDTASAPVTVLGPPQAAFTFSPTVPNPGDAVSFDASASSDGGGIAAYAWDFGDGTTGSGPSPTHAYASPGDRTVTLTTTSAFDGSTATATATVPVNAPPLAGFAVVPAAPRTGDPVTLYSLASDPDGAGDITAIAWDLDGDGAFDDAAGPIAQATFLTAGSATLAQRVTDRHGASATAFRTVEVTGAPVSAASPGTVAVSGAGTTTSTLGSNSTSTAGTRGTADRIRTLKLLSSVRVRLAGTVAGPITTITSLSVVAPKGATIRVRCAGSGCTTKTFKKRVARTGSVRLKQLQRQFRAGARITFDVTKTGYVPKRITLTFRSGRAPSRVERCLLPGAQPGQTKVAACPAS